MDKKISFDLDFPPLEPPDNWQLGVTECWQLADGSIIWKVEGRLIAEFPQLSLAD